METVHGFSYLEESGFVVEESNALFLDSDIFLKNDNVVPFPVLAFIPLHMQRVLIYIDVADKIRQLAPPVMEPAVSGDGYVPVDDPHTLPSLENRFSIYFFYRCCTRVVPIDTVAALGWWLFVFAGFILRENGTGEINKCGENKKQKGAMRKEFVRAAVSQCGFLSK